MALYPVILCGGSGTRLWPCSRTLHPKQFMDLQGHTLFEDTLDRALPLGSTLIIVCNEEHRFYVATVLQKRGLTGIILLEPEGRNTAPAIALAALAAISRDPEAVLLVLPSDHVLTPQKNFEEAVAIAKRCADQGFLTSFGLIPHEPETGFGYIKQGLEIDAGVYQVDAFIEKPDRKRAEQMLASGDYLWNSGMFLFTAMTYLDALQKYAPDVHTACSTAWGMSVTDNDFIRLDKELFKSVPNISIDYAIMERAANVALVPLDASWSDLGSWDAFYQIAPKDAHGNVTIGDVLTQDVNNSYVHAEHRLVATLGIENLVVIETADAVLVTKREAVQDIKKLVASLQAERRSEIVHHQRIFRPWGSYERLACGTNFQVKRIMLSSGSSISLQRHKYRAEHWVVAQGTAEVTLDGIVSHLKAGESVYITVGAMHRLHNPDPTELIIIEIQSGSYLGEDDIERFEDKYGRA